MSGRVRTIDLGPACLDACETDHSSHRPDAVEWAESRLHVREAMETRSGRFMSAADLPGHGWVQEVADLMLALPRRQGADSPGPAAGLVLALTRAWQAARAQSASSLRLRICLPGSSAWVVDMAESDGGLEVQLTCADADAVQQLSTRADALVAALQSKLQCRVRVVVVHGCTSHRSDPADLDPPARPGCTP